MLPLEVIQLFVYLMAPLLSSMREQDFQTLKLENGLRLWQQLWGFRQPDVPCFATPVKFIHTERTRKRDFFCPSGEGGGLATVNVVWQFATSLLPFAIYQCERF